MEKKTKAMGTVQSNFKSIYQAQVNKFTVNAKLSCSISNATTADQFILAYIVNS